MRLRIVILLLAIAALGAGTAPAAAQGRARPLLAQALERTDQRIAMAIAAIGGGSRPDAGAELDAARDLQAAARRAFAGPAPPREVYDLTMRARDHADRAIAIVHGLPDPDRVVAQLEQTRDGVDRATDLLRDCRVDRAHALLEQAADMQDLAESAAREDRYLAALQLTFGARERLLRALRLCGREDAPETTSVRALERTDRVVARARLALGDRAAGPAAEALRRAEALQEKALEQQRANQHEAAMRLTFGARASALRALRLVPGRR